MSPHFSLCRVHKTHIMDRLNLGKTHFQDPGLLGNLHSVDITRRIGGLICCSLALNVIYTGQLVAWTSIVRGDLHDHNHSIKPQKAGSRENGICMEENGASSPSAALNNSSGLRVRSICRFEWKKNTNTNVVDWLYWLVLFGKRETLANESLQFFFFLYPDITVLLAQ